MNATSTEVEGLASSSDQPSAVLFGYGHYARTIVTSGVRHALNICAVHEIDPTLIPLRRSAGVRWDTSPTPRKGERYDAYLIAGYHHTHAPLASLALRQGAAAVVEKPIAMDRAQLRELLDAIRQGGGRFYAGFHKRYSPLNELALRDLRVKPGDAIDYHCVVFEEPLPARHWYRWPNSRTRILSNGCHWIDHFLYLNEWSPPTTIQVARGGRFETTNVSMQLTNGAFFSMLLTEVGSGRIGVRDHVELRAGEITVTVENSAVYSAENSSRVIRRTSVSKMSSYENMYRVIADRVANGGEGDSLESVEVSCGAILDVEERFLACGSDAVGVPTT
jgi:predicted dehydrogenase